MQKRRRIIYLFAFVSTVTALFVCAAILGRKHEPESSVALPVNSAGAPLEPPSRFPAAPRIIAVGDLHGDLETTRAVLRMAGAIDTGDNWIGNNLVVVQTGDAVDRGDDDRAILDLFAELEKESAEAGGAFRPLLGNHELINVMGNYEYVSPRAMTAFDDLTPDSFKRSKGGNFSPTQRGRAAAFRPGGPIAAVLARRNVIAIVGDTLFVHAGVLPEHVEYGIDRINRETRAYIRGDAASLPSIMIEKKAPVWTRHFSLPANLSQSTCETLQKVLDSLQVKRMVVGHTVQEQGLNSSCVDRVYRIDTGMSSSYAGGVPSALEISGGLITPLTGELP